MYNAARRRPRARRPPPRRDPGPGPRRGREGLIAFAGSLRTALVPRLICVASRLAGDARGSSPAAPRRWGGPVVWGYLRSDIALVLFLALLLLDRWLAWWSGGTPPASPWRGRWWRWPAPRACPRPGASSLGRLHPPRHGAGRGPWVPVAEGSSSWPCSARSTAPGSRPRSPRSRCRHFPVETIAVASKYGVDCCGAAPRPVPLRCPLASRRGRRLSSSAARPRLASWRSSPPLGFRCGCGSRSWHSCSRWWGRTCSWAFTSIAT